MLWFEEESKKHVQRGEDFKIVIADVRFHHEVRNIKKMGGLVCKIQRPSLSNSDMHPSEMEMETIVPDIEIMNDGSLEDLYSKVENLLCTKPNQ